MPTAPHSPDRPVLGPASGKPEPIDVFVIADVRLYAEGLSEVVDGDPRFRLVGAAGNAADAISALTASGSDHPIILLDLAMADGRQALVIVSEALPAASVVALAVREVDRDVVEWAEAGVAGIVGSNASIDDLLGTVESVSRGELRCTPKVAAVLLRRVSQAARAVPAGPAHDALSRRELEIMTLVDEGCSNKQIAARLHIGIPTVKNHVHNILQKLEVSGRADAVALLRSERSPAAGSRR